jgi:DNA-binding transcriptional LysR family regulator
MARIESFTGLSEFLAVAEHESFRAAAAALGVTSPSVSQAIRALEKRVGKLLFQRTTRHVALTETGRTFLARLRPATVEIGEALEDLSKLQQRPTGSLRLSVPRIAVALILERVLPEFRRAHPEVTVEVDVDDNTIDLFAGSFDAGIRVGELIERDMIAVRLTADCSWLVLGAPSYFTAHGKPRSLRDLVEHECIRYRFPTARTTQRWQFLRNGREFSIDPPGGVIVNDTMTLIALAKRGMGLIYTADILVTRELAAGELARVLGTHLRSTAGLFLYFPAKSQSQSKLRAFINMAKQILNRSS